MALTESAFPGRIEFPRRMAFPGAAFDPERPARSPDDGALRACSSLHGEAGRNLALAQFLARAPGACVVLMLTGALILIWAARGGGAALKAQFCLGGAGAAGHHRHDPPPHPGLCPLAAAHAAGGSSFGPAPAASLYGRGLGRRRLPDHAGPSRPGPGFLLRHPAQPGPGPDLADAKGFAAFAAPAILLIAGAALLGAWPLDMWVAGAIMARSCAQPWICLADLPGAHCGRTGLSAHPGPL